VVSPPTGATVKKILLVGTPTRGEEASSRTLETESPFTLRLVSPPTGSMGIKILLVGHQQGGKKLQAWTLEAGGLSNYINKTYPALSVHLKEL